MLALILTAALSPSAEYDLYVLAGQSNMEGFGRVSELPGELAGPVEGAVVYHGNTGADGSAVPKASGWVPVKPGHGSGYWNAGGTENVAPRFGPELTFARRMRRLRPGRKVAIIKYARGGTSLAEEAAGDYGSWDPDYAGGENAGANQLDFALATIAAAARSPQDVDKDGTPDTLVPRGIVWMQGESDARSRSTAQTYGANLASLVGSLRGGLKADVPVVIGRISDSGQDSDGTVWDAGELLRAQQAAFVEGDSRAGLVTATDEYGYSDPYHYDTAGFVDLGRQFAESLDALRNASEAATPAADNAATPDGPKAAADAGP